VFPSLSLLNGGFHKSIPCSKLKKPYWMMYEIWRLLPIISDLPEDHYDGLTFSVIFPHFSEHRYNANGTRTTKLQRKQMEEGESSDMANDSGSVDSEGPTTLPAAKIVEIMEDVQPTGTSALAPSDT
jgi:hypothetical protein